jgi:hypothetical protein
MVAGSFGGWIIWWCGDLVQMNFDPFSEACHRNPPTKYYVVVHPPSKYLVELRKGQTDAGGYELSKMAFMDEATSEVTKTGSIGRICKISMPKHISHEHVSSTKESMTALYFLLPFLER